MNRITFLPKIHGAGLKQHLRINKFYGTSDYAMKGQIRAEQSRCVIVGTEERGVFSLSIPNSVFSSSVIARRLSSPTSATSSMYGLVESTQT
jgi:hypothetical protein